MTFLMGDTSAVTFERTSLNAQIQFGIILPFVSVHVSKMLIVYSTGLYTIPSDQSLGYTFDRACWFKIANLIILLPKPKKMY